MESENKEIVLSTLLEDVENLMEELYQSGFGTVHDSTLTALKEMTELTGQYGMAYLSELLGQLTEGISMRRHQTRQTQDHLATIYTKLNEYLYLCEEKTLYDKGKSYYTQLEQ